ncbi:MAG: GNAT family protein [Nocardioides sp.]
MTDPGWPAVLRHGEITLRPLRPTDERAWREARSTSAAWLSRWEATVPPGAEPRPMTFRAMVRGLRRRAREGSTYPFALLVDGRFAGQVSVNNIVRSSGQYASVGYWIDERYAGRGLMPRAVAMVIDHCLTTAGLHRLEIAIRPENTNSLRVVEKLGLREVGFFPRFLHIDGAWRDHRIYAITVEEWPPGGLLGRVEAAEGSAPHQSHE